MAIWGHIISKQLNRCSSLKVPLVNGSINRSCRFVSSQTTDASLENPLIQEASITQESRVRDNEPKTFEELFKKSAFVSLGNPKGKIVIGTIKKVVEDNLYIDFGWKFPCVCSRPTVGSGSYVRGRKVRLMIRELELATKFLGSDVEVTLNEADCVLLGIHSPRASQVDENLSASENKLKTPRVRESKLISEMFAEEALASKASEAEDKGKD